MNASTAAGLSDNLDDLAKLVDQDDEGEGWMLQGASLLSLNVFTSLQIVRVRKAS